MCIISDVWRNNVQQWHCTYRQTYPSQHPVIQFINKNINFTYIIKCWLVCWAWEQILLPCPTDQPTFKQM